jgi:hypothetical protein
VHNVGALKMKRKIENRKLRIEKPVAERGSLTPSEAFRTGSETRVRHKEWIYTVVISYSIFNFLFSIFFLKIRKKMKHRYHQI